MKTLINTTIALLFVLSFAAHAKTQNFYKCTGKVGGEWNFGDAPQACDASAFGDDDFISANYENQVFNLTVNRSLERNRYTQDMYAIIRDSAGYYIESRNPKVSAEEKNWWVLGIVMVASQESRMSHYRKGSDGRFKMERGDLGHGHGLMQIDDRSHFPAISKGVAWNLITNLTYAMDIYYAQWVRAPNQHCVKGANDWENRIRASWSAYNGGPGSICRFSNSRSSWSQNDIDFEAILRTHAWKPFVRDESIPASINVTCLIEHKENCPVAGSPIVKMTSLPSEAVLYETADQHYCIFLQGHFTCANEYRDSLCLEAITSFNLTAPVNAASPQWLAQYPVKNIDRHSLCQKYDPSLFSVGTILQLQQDTILRATPNGGNLATIPAGQTLEVLDFELRKYPENDRYYQVKFNNQLGFIYAGSKNTTVHLVKNSSQPLPNSTIAKKGDYITIINKMGINLRTKPSGTKLLHVPMGIRLQVQDTVIQGNNNDVYFRINYKNQTGYLYSGRILPKDTTMLWTSRSN
jgi:hypothetical protein